MPIDPSWYLDAAEEIQQGEAISQEEVRYRTALGRAYYAGYLATRQSLRTQYGDPTFDVHHGDLSRALVGATNSAVAQVGAKLDTLRGFRDKADYNLRATITERDCKFALRKAQRFLGELAAVDGLLPRGIPRRR